MRTSRGSFAFVAALLLASCSTVKATQKTGAEISDVAKCETVSCFFAHPTVTLISETQTSDDVSLYRFSYLRRQGSVLRGAGYGVLGVATLGLSEIVTNPVEEAIQNDRVFVVDAICDRQTRVCGAVAITESDGSSTLVRGKEADFLTNGS